MNEDNKKYLRSLFQKAKYFENKFKYASGRQIVLKSLLRETLGYCNALVHCGHITRENANKIYYIIFSKWLKAFEESLEEQNCPTIGKGE